MVVCAPIYWAYRLSTRTPRVKSLPLSVFKRLTLVSAIYGSADRPPAVGGERAYCLQLRASAERKMEVGKETPTRIGSAGLAYNTHVVLGNIDALQINLCGWSKHGRDLELGLKSCDTEAHQER